MGQTVTRLTMVIILQCLEISNHCCVPGTKVVLQVSFTSIKKDNRIIFKMLEEKQDEK